MRPGSTLGLDYGDIKRDFFDGPRSTSGRRFARRVANRRRRALDRLAVEESEAGDVHPRELPCDCDCGCCEAEP